MKITSVNVGVPRDVLWRGVTVRTGIFKEPAEGPVRVRRLNLDGDRQADLTVHGGPDKAVYLYPAEYYEYWRRELPEVAFPWGKFGENLTVEGWRDELLNEEGLVEDAVHIGDHLQVGSAVLMVTQPRLPCYKLALKFDRDDMIKRFLLSGRSGFYFSVVEPGEVSAGAKVEILSRDPNKVTVADIQRMYFSKHPDLELLHRAIGVSALPQSWRDWLQEQTAGRS